MSYSEMTDTAWSKFQGYSIEQCEHAISDIHETLDATPNGRDFRNPYVQKLWCELDAARDRIREITRGAELDAARDIIRKFTLASK
jgi:hypothetical protein